MKNKKTLSSISLITVLLSLTLLVAEQPSAEAHRIYFGRRRNLDMELSPERRIFHPNENGYFYPGSPSVTKRLEVINVGQVPFRICRLKASFHGDKYLARGLRIRIMGRARWGSNFHLLYIGALSRLHRGVEVGARRTVPKGRSLMLYITVWMPKTAGNEYQGLSMSSDISITVRYQYTNNWERT